MRQAILLLFASILPTIAVADPLPSWQDSPVKTVIIEFVEAVSDPASADFVPEPERVAVFDNDGTSWCERPGYVPTEFQVNLLRNQVAAGKVDPDEMPFRAWLDNNTDALR